MSPGGEVEADDLVHEDAGVALAAEQGAERRGDVGRRQAAGRHLVEQRLEQVEVAPVDERDFDRDLAQRLGGVKAAEAAADDDDAVLAVHARWPPDSARGRPALSVCPGAAPLSG